LKRFVQLIQPALACGILVALIFSIPMVMAATPIHLGFSFMGPRHLLAEHQSASDQSSSFIP
jgi:hypothetical protein